MLHVHGTSVPVQWTRFIHTIDKHSLKPIASRNGEAPKALKGGDSATIEFTPKRPVCLEPFDLYPNLGRIAFVNSRSVIGIGIVVSVERCNFDRDPTLLVASFDHWINTSRVSELEELGLTRDLWRVVHEYMCGGRQIRKDKPKSLAVTTAAATATATDPKQ